MVRDPAASLLWRAISRWLPRWFRARYRAEVLASHVQRVGGAARARGMRFWAPLLWDVFVTGLQVRWEGENDGRRLRVLSAAAAQELGHAVRQVTRQPGFVAAVAVTLGLGIGANVMMFSILDRLLLSPPPGVRGAERVRAIYIYGKSPFASAPGYLRALAYPDLAAFEQTRAFAAVAGHAQQDLTLGRGGAAGV